MGSEIQEEFVPIPGIILGRKSVFTVTMTDATHTHCSTSLSQGPIQDPSLPRQVSKLLLDVSYDLQR